MALETLPRIQKRKNRSKFHLCSTTYDPIDGDCSRPAFPGRVTAVAGRAHARKAPGRGRDADCVVEGIAHAKVAKDAEVF